MSLLEQKKGISEIFVTQVMDDKKEHYRQWLAKIQKVEASFPGFQGTFVQEPQNGGKTWITILQFDSVSNLDKWLSSPERLDILEESKPLIISLENYRMISPYAGWFKSLNPSSDVQFSVVKQTMIVLLVLFPIVMLEMRYMNPLLAHLNLSLATFIGNAISVSLVSWPMVPLAIYGLGWWLNTKKEKRMLTNIAGTSIVLLLYLVEVFLLWN